MNEEPSKPDQVTRSTSSMDKEWDAEKYHQVSQPQVAWGKAVLERLSKIGLRGDETIVDAGCGTGRLTADLLDRWPHVRVIAIDSSHNMLETAARHLERFGERVSLRCADLQHWHDDHCADVIFSTATFHWIQDHPKLFANLHRSLRFGGWLCAQCGGGPNIARHHARADTLLRSAPFRAYFSDWAEPWEFANAEVTRARLADAGFARVETDLEAAPVVFPDSVTFRDYVATVILRPHLARLPDELRPLFVDRMTQLAAADDPPFLVDYWRLNLLGQRAAP
jgi:trans-aconitate 2-methyltransferase